MHQQKFGYPYDYGDELTSEMTGSNIKKMLTILLIIWFVRTRMLVQPGQNGGPDQIVAIFMRRDLDKIALIFKGKYK